MGGGEVDSIVLTLHLKALPLNLHFIHLTPRSALEVHEPYIIHENAESTFLYQLNTSRVLSCYFSNSKRRPGRDNPHRRQRNFLTNKTNFRQFQIYNIIYCKE